MPAYVAHRAQNALNEVGEPSHGSSVLLLGVTYKADIADQRESPAVALARHLLARCRVSFHDPYVTEWMAFPDLVPATDLEHAVGASDVTILVQNHRRVRGGRPGPALAAVLRYPWSHNRPESERL